jgi:hypothetical protein
MYPRSKRIFASEAKMENCILSSLLHIQKKKKQKVALVSPSFLNNIEHFVEKNSHRCDNVYKD